MSQPLTVLIVEDNPVDAELTIRELQRAGFAPEWRRVDTEEAFLQHLDSKLDLVLSDYQMPRFDGLRALELLRRSGLEVPLIIVSGTIGEDTAVEAMKRGAADYLLKDRLGRLGPVVLHALEQTRLRRERNEAAAALRESEERFATLFRSSPVALALISQNDGRLLDVNDAWVRLTGHARAASVGRTPGELNVIAPADHARIFSALATSPRT
ncbi:MAG: response regulator, partial [Opitutaceae bacterium]